MSLIKALLAHQLELSGAALSIILLGACLGIPFFEKFIYIEGKQLNGNYIKNFNDIYYVLFWFVFMTFIRTYLMERVFVPFVKSCGAKSKIIVEKFKEQAFMFTFYSISWSVGIYLVYHSPYWLNTSQFWIGYPHLELQPGIKRFYLFQMGYWLQQLFYVQIEVRRKDYFNMLTHHIITNILMFISYYCNYTRMGHVFLTLMDFSDIFLSVAKVLNYLKFSKACDIMFGLFVLSWIPSRHIGYMFLIWSIMVDPLRYNDEKKWDPANGIYFTESVRVVFLTLLLSLQALMLVWFKMILLVLWRIVKGENATDVRSSDEEGSDLEKKRNLKNK